MIDKQVNKLMISLNTYRDMDTVYRKVGEAIRTLLESGYIVLSYNLGGNKDFVIIEYVENSPDGLKPMWLTKDELEEMVDNFTEDGDDLGDA